MLRFYHQKADLVLLCRAGINDPRDPTAANDHNAIAKRQQNVKIFTDEEISRLSVVAPNVVLSIIRDYDVVEKKEVITPDELHGIVRCGNPKCITNNEPMSTFFHVVNKAEGTLKCHYCEKEQNKSEVKLV